MKTLDDVLEVGYNLLNGALKDVEAAISYGEDITNIACTNELLKGMFALMVKLDAVAEILIDIRDKEKSDEAGSYMDMTKAVTTMVREWPNGMLANEGGQGNKAYVNVMQQLRDPNYVLKLKQQEGFTILTEGLDELPLLRYNFDLYKTIDGVSCKALSKGMSVHARTLAQATKNVKALCVENYSVVFKDNAVCPKALDDRLSYLNCKICHPESGEK